MGRLDPKNGWEFPVLAVFQKNGSDVRLFWRGEMTKEMAEPGKDPRGGPDIGSVWTILDLTTEGRGTDCYPKLSYVG